jgi:hypothetical protein
MQEFPDSSCTIVSTQAYTLYKAVKLYNEYGTQIFTTLLEGTTIRLCSRTERKGLFGCKVISHRTYPNRFIPALLIITDNNTMGWAPEDELCEAIPELDLHRLRQRPD